MKGTPQSFTLRTLETMNTMFTKRERERERKKERWDNGDGVKIPFKLFL
jgi:hypothetical protein